MEQRKDQLDEYDIVRNETLAEDIIKALRGLEKYSSKLKAFVRESLQRGYNRAILKNGVPLFEQKVSELIAIAEGALSVSDSPKAKLISIELAAVKSTLQSFSETLEKILMEEPLQEKQLFINTLRRIK